MAHDKASSRLSTRTLPIILSVGVVAAISVGVGLWLSSPCTGFCIYHPPELVVAARLGSNGLVTFSISNNINTDLTIISVAGFAGTNSTAFGTVSLSNNNVVPAKGSLTLPVQFQHTEWQPSLRYLFQLTLLDGDRYGVYQCLNGC